MKEITEGDLFDVNMHYGGHKDDKRTYKLLSASKFIVQLIKPSQYQIDSDRNFSTGKWKENPISNVESAWFKVRGIKVI